MTAGLVEVEQAEAGFVLVDWGRLHIEGHDGVITHIAIRNRGRVE